MGRTVATISMFIDSIEHGAFAKFVKGALPQEKRIIRSLFARSRNHIWAISMAGHLLPFETILLAMQHEQQKQIKALSEKLKK